MQNITSESMNEINIFAAENLKSSSYDQLMKAPVPGISVAGIYFITALMIITLFYLYFAEINVIVQARGFTENKGKSMQILAKVANKDIGLIRKNIPVEVKVDAFPYLEFGTISGQVEKIMPNIDNKSYFTIVVKLNRQFLEKKDKHYDIFPGLAVSVDCITRRIPVYMLIFKNFKN